MYAMDQSQYLIFKICHSMMILTVSFQKPFQSNLVTNNYGKDVKHKNGCYSCELY